MVNYDESEVKLEVASQEGTANALPNSAQQEEDKIPRVIVTTSFPWAIAISSSPQAQKVKEQSGSGLGVVEQEAIAPTNITQEEQETLPRVIVTSRIEGAIATSSTSQQQRISEPQRPKDISPPVPSPVKPQPVVPKKLSEEEIQKLENELKRLKINLEPCMNVIQKYWNNLNGAIARVKEAIQAGWCNNATGLFIASCKKGVKPQKTQVSNDLEFGLKG